MRMIFEAKRPKSHLPACSTCGWLGRRDNEFGEAWLGRIFTCLKNVLYSYIREYMWMCVNWYSLQVRCLETRGSWIRVYSDSSGWQNSSSFLWMNTNRAITWIESVHVRIDTYWCSFDVDVIQNRQYLHTHTLSSIILPWLVILLPSALTTAVAIFWMVRCFGEKDSTMWAK